MGGVNAEGGTAEGCAGGLSFIKMSASFSITAAQRRSWVKKRCLFLLAVFAFSLGGSSTGYLYWASCRFSWLRDARAGFFYVPFAISLTGLLLKEYSSSSSPAHRRSVAVPFGDGHKVMSKAASSKNKKQGLKR
jgi:hypothetical protein